MEESVVPKRGREESQVKDGDAVGYCEESSKRHKPYNHILSLLESEEEPDNSTQQDLSPLITTLQQEIFTCNSNSSSSHDDTLLSPSQNIDGQLDTNLTTTTTTTTTKSLDSLEDCSTRSIIAFAATITHSNGGSVLEEDDKVGLMRHLLEASDDELGIPNRGELEGSLMDDFSEDGFISGGDMFASSICDALWEVEDETANYYALLHSELLL